MAKKYSGIKKVEYSPTGANTFTEIGVPLTDGSIKNEAAKVETSKGTQLYAGTNKEGNFVFTTDTAYTALETAMKADTELDIRLTYMDNTTEIIAVGANITVSKTIKSKVGELNGFELAYKTFSV